MRKGLKKWLFWGAGIIAAVLLLILGHSLVVTNLRPKLIAELKESVHASSGRLYKLEFDRIRLNLLWGRTQAFNVRLIPDTLVYDSLRSAGRDIHTLYTVNSDKIDIRGVNLLKAARKKEVDIRSLHIDNPRVMVLNDTAATGTTAAEKADNGFNAYELIRPTLNALSIQEVRLRDGSLVYQKRAGKENGSRFELTGLQLSADDLHIDSTANGRENLFYSEDLRLSMGRFRYFTPDSLYILHIGSAGLSSKEAALRADSIWLQPRYGDMEFHQVAGKKIDRTEVKIKTAEASGIDLKALMQDRDLIMQQLTIENADINNFLYNYDYEKPYRDLPHVKLLDLKKRIHVARLRIRQADIVHRERLAGHNYTGHVDFNRIDAEFRNITNMPEVIDANNFLTADVKAYLMDIGEMKVRFEFPLASPEDAFKVTGSIGRMPLRAINTILVPSTYIQVRSGTVNRLNFNFSADNKASSGTTQFYYHNLRVKILSQDEERKNRRLLTKLTNILVIDKDNPVSGESLESGDIYFQRIQNRSIFNYLWKSMLEGIKTSVGLSLDKKDQLNRLIEDFRGLNKQDKGKSGKSLKDFFNK